MARVIPDMISMICLDTLWPIAITKSQRSLSVMTMTGDTAAVSIGAGNLPLHEWFWVTPGVNPVLPPVKNLTRMRRENAMYSS
ncbi:unnamed protein product [Enterobius vermicularis]|uniref:Secreted protein n=1 Tax=Enterobius vermicularis TaxID=51028 RepID=A0A0N4VR09_ENTVE|nr:unnamed protein product [Enterobius vermicularis]